MSDIKTVADAVSVLSSEGIEVRQMRWRAIKDLQLPYALLVPGDPHQLSTADGIAHEYREYDIQLYTERRDIALEKRVTAALREAGIRTPMPDVVLDANGPAYIAYYHVSLTE